IGNVQAVTAFLRPTAKTRLDQVSAERVAEMMQRTGGTHGSCFQYFATLHKKLREVGVVDSEVEAIAHLVLADPGQLPLVPKAILREERFFYHITGEERWDRIRNEGLRPEYVTRMGYSLTP